MTVHGIKTGGKLQQRKQVTEKKQTKSMKIKLNTNRTYYYTGV